MTSSIPGNAETVLRAVVYPQSLKSRNPYPAKNSVRWPIPWSPCLAAKWLPLLTQLKFTFLSFLLHTGHLCISHSAIHLAKNNPKLNLVLHILCTCTLTANQCWRHTHNQADLNFRFLAKVNLPHFSTPLFHETILSFFYIGRPLGLLPPISLLLFSDKTYIEKKSNVPIVFYHCVYQSTPPVTMDTLSSPTA